MLCDLLRVLWVYQSAPLPVTERLSSLSSSARPGGVLCSILGGWGGGWGQEVWVIIIVRLCEWQPLRREGTHLAGSVCAIIVSYPLVLAFSSSSLFIIICVCDSLVCVCVGVILEMCVGPHMSREDRVVLPCVCVCVPLHRLSWMHSPHVAHAGAVVGTFFSRSAAVYLQSGSSNLLRCSACNSET